MGCKGGSLLHLVLLAISTMDSICDMTKSSVKIYGCLMGGLGIVLFCGLPAGESSCTGGEGVAYAGTDILDITDAIDGWR